MCNAQAADEHTTQHIRMPGYRPNKDTVARASGELRQYLADNGPATVVYNMLDSGTYYANTIDGIDGTLILARRDHRGRHHIDGELMVAPIVSFLLKR